MPAPDQPPAPPAELVKPPPSPWATRIFIIFVLLCVAGWLCGRPTLDMAKHWWATWLAARAREKIAKEAWNDAYKDMVAANRWDSDDPEVIRVTIELLQKTQSDPTAVLQKLQTLDERGLATDDDLVEMGRLLLTQGNLRGVRTILERLPPAEREKHPALELEANMLREEGRPREAEQVLRKALAAAAKNDAMSRLRLAILDHQSAFPEMKIKARQTLWDLARVNDRTALQAILLLADDTNLTPQEADELLRLIEASPAKSMAARLQVLSAFLRVRPQDRDAVLQREIAANENKGVDELVVLLRWLHSQKEHEAMLRLIPATLAAKSPEILDLRLQALAALDRWPEIQALMLRPAGITISKAQASLWLAEAYEHLEKDLDRTQQQLLAAYEAAGRGRDGHSTLRAAQIAERLSLWDIARDCYEGLAAAQPKLRVQMLEKVSEVCLHARDSTALLENVRRLAALNPGNPEYEERLLYLQLVMGADVETTSLQLKSDNPITTASGIPEPLYHALAAYRMGDLDGVRRAIFKVEKTGTLKAGPRAVYAGLLSAAGQLGAGYRLAEQIPPALLLPEELRFLRRAR